MLSIRVRRIALASIVTFTFLLVFGELLFNALRNLAELSCENPGFRRRGECGFWPMAYLGLIVLFSYSVPLKLVEIFVDKKTRKSSITSESNPIYLLFGMILLFFTFWMLSKGIDLNAVGLLQLAGLSVLGNILFELVWSSVAKAKK